MTRTGEVANVIMHNGRVITVDPASSIQSAIAVRAVADCGHLRTSDGLEADRRKRL